MPLPKTPRNRAIFSADSRSGRQVSGYADSMAEREGFEPSIGLTYTPLAGARLRPLGHLSGARESTETRPDRLLPASLDRADRN